MKRKKRKKRKSEEVKSRKKPEEDGRSCFLDVKSRREECV